MKYTINLDENNYVLSIAHTNNDDVELNLEEIETSYLQAYKYTGGNLVLDETKKAEMIAEEEKRREEEEQPSAMDRLEAQVTYTALMTDTLIGG